MKNVRLFLLGSSVVFACAAASVSASVTWSSDTTSNFAFTISGTGSAWGPGNLVSPSGIWDFPGGGDMELLSTNQVLLFQGGLGADFTPTSIAANFPGYEDKFTVPGQFIDGNSLYDTPAFSGWSGNYSISFDIPNPQDSSTWSWSMSMSGKGPALSDPGLALAIPEPNSLLLVCFGFLALPILHRRRR
jgi:hypothetical protein